MDILQEKMQDGEFNWVYYELGFRGKGEDGYYTIYMYGLENDYEDAACYLFTDYDKLKKFIGAWFGEQYYEFLCGVYTKYGHEHTPNPICTIKREINIYDDDVINR